MSPNISVIMPIFNSEKYLRGAIESILHQTYSNFEFIIIDDGSTDNSLEIAQQYGRQDSRIRIIKNEQNIGLTKSLIKGAALANGIYIARMDSDDISLPQRFEKQISFMDKHPEIGISGSECYFIDCNGRKIFTQRLPESDFEIRWIDLFRSPFIHPTVIIRKKILLSCGLNYDESFPVAQDYDFFSRLLNHTKGANISEPLLLYRLHPSSVTSKSLDLQEEVHRSVSLRTIITTLPELNLKQEEIVELINEIGQLHGQLRNKKRIALARSYIKVWNLFKQKYGDGNDMREVKKNIVIKLSRLTCYPLFQPDMFNMMGQISKIDPYWPFIFFISLPSGIMKKLFSIRLLLARDIN